MLLLLFTLLDRGPVRFLSTERNFPHLWSKKMQAMHENVPRTRLKSTSDYSPVQAGDFHGIVRQYAERIFNHALRMVANREEAEEITEDVFMRIYRGLGSFRGDAQLSTWIWRITTNVCLTRRGRKRLQTLPLDGEEVGEGPADENAWANPEGLLMDQEMSEGLARSIAMLPDQEAAAITLFYLDGMSYTEIGTILGLPPGTVATALHRGRERLRRIIPKENIRV